MTFDDYLALSTQTTEAVQSAILKARMYLSDPRYTKIMASISGGSDSDIMLDILEHCRGEKIVDYYFFDTGVEYKATRDHLDYLEERYGIKINRVKAVKPIPICVKEYGQPFISKQTSERLGRMIKAGFDFRNDGNKSFDELLQKYPNLNDALKVWCNKKECGLYNIEQRYRFLKEFMIEHPPTFRISSQCCVWTKKKLAHKIAKDYDMSCIGVRKAEGGVRANAYKSCFDDDGRGIANFRPIFWFTEEDKRAYEAIYEILHSDCYTKYGFKRTGCAGCPFNLRIFDDLEALEIYEPQFAKAARTIFKDSYEYTRRYREFRDKMKAAEKKQKEIEETGMEQIDLFGEEEE